MRKPTIHVTKWLTDSDRGHMLGVVGSKPGIRAIRNGQDGRNFSTVSARSVLIFLCGMTA